MKKFSHEQILSHYHATRRANFAASQRLEGIFTPVTKVGGALTLPSKEALIEKYSRLKTIR